MNFKKHILLSIALILSISYSGFGQEEQEESKTRLVIHASYSNGPVHDFFLEGHKVGLDIEIATGIQRLKLVPSISTLVLADEPFIDNDYITAKYNIAEFRFMVHFDIIDTKIFELYIRGGIGMIGSTANLTASDPRDNKIRQNALFGGMLSFSFRINISPKHSIDLFTQDFSFSNSYLVAGLGIGFSTAF